MKTAKQVTARVHEIAAELKLQVTVKQGPKTIAVTIEGPHGKRKMFAPCTPSCWRASMNMKTDMKRIATLVGAYQPKHA